MDHDEWKIEQEKILNKEICCQCKQPFNEGYFIDKHDVNGKFWGRFHHDCFGDNMCVKCGKHMSNLTNIAWLLTPMQDRCMGQGIEDIQRILLCGSCYKLVYHFALAKIGVDACT